MQISNNLPQEFFVQIKGLEDHLKGRITLYQGIKGFDLEIDIVQSESGKIYNHVKSMYNHEDPRDAIDMAVQHLKDYLVSKSK